MLPDDGSETSVCFTSSSHGETAESLEEILLEQGSYTGSGQVIDVRGQESSNRNLVTIINVFSYGFIVLISLIAATNVFNTISTNVALRRRGICHAPLGRNDPFRSKPDDEL